MIQVSLSCIGADWAGVRASLPDRQLLVPREALRVRRRRRRAVGGTEIGDDQVVEQDPDGALGDSIEPHAGPPGIDHHARMDRHLRPNVVRPKQWHQVHCRGIVRCGERAGVAVRLGEVAPQAGELATIARLDPHLDLVLLARNNREGSYASAGLRAVREGVSVGTVPVVRITLIGALDDSSVVPTVGPLVAAPLESVLDLPILTRPRG